MLCYLLQRKRCSGVSAIRLFSIIIIPLRLEKIIITQCVSRALLREMGSIMDLTCLDDLKLHLDLFGVDHNILHVESVSE